MSATGYTPKTYGRCTFCPDPVTHVVRTENGAYFVCAAHVENIERPKIVSELPTEKGTCHEH